MALEALLLAATLLFLSVNAFSQSPEGDTDLLSNITQTDENGTFRFVNLSPGCYNLTAYKMILGAMHFLGDATVNLSQDVDNVSITVARSNDARYSCFQNASANLTPGSFNLSGVVLGPNRPGAEPKEIPYEDATVKITSFIEGK